MLVGAAIYVGTFMLSANWDYRLIFLIFCIPFLQHRPFPLGPRRHRRHAAGHE
jgi:hypothetical protein